MAKSTKQKAPKKNSIVKKSAAKKAVKRSSKPRLRGFTPHGKKLLHYVPAPSDHPVYKLASPYVGAVPAVIPNDVDMRPLCLLVRSDFIDGPCAGFATAAFRELTWTIANNNQLPPEYLSPAFLYAYTRQKEGTFPSLAFTSVADEFYSLQTYGVCPESLMPYTSGNLTVPPSSAAMNAAPQFRVSSATPVDFSVVANVQAILADRHPIVISFTVYPSYSQTGPTGWIPMPVPGEQPGGGHAVLLCGYHIDPLDPSQDCWIVRTEDTSFGLQGYAYMPAGYERTWIQAFTA